MKKMKKSKSKKFKNDVPEIPFLYDFYLIYWEDIQSDSSWKEMEDIQNMKPATCVSTGWLVKSDKKVHILMSDYNYNNKMEMGDGGNTTVIPTKNVIKKYKPVCIFNLAAETHVDRSIDSPINFNLWSF